ncbi:hypothetical protein DPMN_158324 [Dreissena polymorpha]|uniref:Uncharacterized protein n=1 Tax=Dreissena polymorpha TaxID=45954 RepID=A0A9D4EJL6_DREPO|nr:hypothetical protein DPMN_158324 [Dreissena polymorpha]
MRLVKIIDFDRTDSGEAQEGQGRMYYDTSTVVNSELVEQFLGTIDRYSVSDSSRKDYTDDSQYVQSTSFGRQTPAEILNNQYKSVCTKEDPNEKKLLKALNVNKAGGPDSIPNKELAPPIYKNFTNRLEKRKRYIYI